MRKSVIIIYGPTAVGKSDYALALANDFPIEIVNCDVGQFYTPLSIGTAKPDWKQEITPHHLFDILDEPSDYTVVQYRKAVLDLCEKIWERNAIPVLVGGSGFYIKSLFFPPLSSESSETLHPEVPLYKGIETATLFVQLQKVDPVRATQVHPHDRYRIERALTLAHQTSGAAHTMHPTYQDIGFPFLLLCLSRDRSQLYSRINYRTEKMLDMGWIEEVEKLQETAWESFLNRKKLIGYNDILSFLKKAQDRKKLAEIIAQKTRHYAKRQMTFWRMLKKELIKHCIFPSSVDDIVVGEEQETYQVLKTRVTTFLDTV